MFSTIYRKLQELYSKDYVRLYLWCAGVVFIWRGILEFINHSFMKLYELPIQTINGVGFGLDRWLAWDGRWYYSIIHEGYFLDYSRSEPSNIPFFPGFPVLVKAISSVVHVHPVYVGLILNVILTTFCVYFLFQITRILARQLGKTENLQNRSAKVAVLLFLIFPSSLFLAAFYSEALLIFGISGAIYYALKKRLLVGAIFAAIASSSKSIGVAVVPVILMIHYQQNCKSIVDLQLLRRKALLYIMVSLIGLSGLLAYMLYLYINFGDPLLFSSLQNLWLREFHSDFLVKLWEIYYRNTLTPTYFEGTFNYIIMLIAMYGPLFALITSMVLSIKYKLYWLLPLVIITIILPASTAILQSMNRYIYCFIPLFALFGIMLIKPKRDFVLICLLALMGIVLIYATTGFLTGRYFAG